MSRLSSIQGDSVDNTGSVLNTVTFMAEPVRLTLLPAALLTALPTAPVLDFITLPVPFMAVPVRFTYDGMPPSE